MKIFLLGFMGTGKTYWGAKWAAQNNMDFFDLDAEIEKSADLTIPQIFEQKGEAFFREKEQEVLKQFGNRQNFILSTGGGTPCFFDNIEWMNANGITIYLDTPVSILRERLVLEKAHRPLIKSLNDSELEDFIKQRLLQRSPFYSQARVTVSTEFITDITFDEIKRSYV